MLDTFELLHKDGLGLTGVVIVARCAHLSLDLGTRAQANRPRVQTIAQVLHATYAVDHVSLRVDSTTEALLLIQSR